MAKRFDWGNWDQSFLAGYDKTREEQIQNKMLLMKMASQRLAERQMDVAERNQQLRELTSLGAPLETIEWGEQLHRAPTMVEGGLRPPVDIEGEGPPRQISVGPTPSPEEQHAMESFDALMRRREPKETVIYENGGFKSAPPNTTVKVAPRRSLSSLHSEDEDIFKMAVSNLRQNPTFPYMGMEEKRAAIEDEFTLLRTLRGESKPVPAKSQPPQFKSPAEVKAAVSGGRLKREDALNILRSQFNYK